MTDCIFCRLIKGELPSDIVYRDDDVIAFRDIDPKAPVHILIIPLKHIRTVNDLSPADQMLVGKMILIAQKIAEQERIDQRGYRLIFNCNRDGGQAVYHIHLHLLGGRGMHWPPG
ncbi:histidine triad nucleotide-binding protein [candidate division KSB1 bacterium]|nr:histidine triad nucleotide-binding protein [candidate division KSB1 bacterium]